MGDSERENEVTNSMKLRSLFSTEVPFVRMMSAASYSSDEIRSDRNKKIAITCILVCELLRNTAVHSVVFWIPLTLKKNDELHNVSILGMLPLAAAIVNNTTCWFIGIITDSFLKKTRVLVVNTVIMFSAFIYVAALLAETSLNIDCFERTNSSLPVIGVGRDIDNITCQLTPVLAAGYAVSTHTVAITYFAAVCLIVLSEAVFETVLPVLAGDQMSSRDAVRKFYAAYYWCWKVGQLISCFASIMFLTKLQTLKTAAEHEKLLKNHILGWCAFDMATITGSFVCLFVVIFGKFLREHRPDVSVIVDTVGIWKEAISRRRARSVGESVLSVAKSSNGGSYADKAVTERRNLGLFFIIILCLVPVSYSTQLKLNFIFDDDDDTDANETAVQLLQESYSINMNDAILNLIAAGTTLIVIPTVYGICQCLYKRHGVSITYLHRLTAGQAIMVLVLASYMIIYDHRYVKERTLALLSIPNILLGVVNALIFTAGFELALIKAPRSMQATSMGIFYCLDGFGSLVDFTTTMSDWDDDYKFYMIAGIASTVLGMILLIVLEFKVGLGLRRL